MKALWPNPAAPQSLNLAHRRSGMRTSTTENFRFTSGPRWAALVMSLPWVLLANCDAIKPHLDWSGAPCAASGLVSLGLLVYSWLRGERQMIFLLIVFVLATMATVLPMVDVGPGYR